MTYLNVCFTPLMHSLWTQALHNDYTPLSQLQAHSWVLSCFVTNVLIYHQKIYNIQTDCPFFIFCMSPYNVKPDVAINLFNGYWNLNRESTFQTHSWFIFVMIVKSQQSTLYVNMERDQLLWRRRDKKPKQPKDSLLEKKAATNNVYFCALSSSSSHLTREEKKFVFQTGFFL